MNDHRNRRLRHPGRAAVLATLLLGLLSSPALHAAEPVASAASDAQVRALQRASDAVVGLEISAIEGARSIDTLGRLRSGSGVVIGDDGLVLTIGYLLLEADDVMLVLDDGRRAPARVVGVDLASGFGLLQSLVPLALPSAPLARDTGIDRDEALLLVSGGSEGAMSVARLSARQAFSGYWEYHIDQALFTHPPRTDHSGAGLFNGRGELLGIGSLLVLDTPGEHERGPGNMFVPVDLLAPVVGELRERGSSRASQRAWLGVSCQAHAGGVRIVNVSPDSPAEAAGLEPGDVITRIDGAPVGALETFYKRLWDGGAERDIMLEVQRDGQAAEVRVHSVDRQQTLRRPSSI